MQMINVIIQYNNMVIQKSKKQMIRTFVRLINRTFECGKYTFVPALLKGYSIFSKLFYWRYYLTALKTAFLCFVSSAFVTAFKVLYKESIETVNRPSTKPPMEKSDENGFQTHRHFL